jgi:hypothetical protein
VGPGIVIYDRVWQDRDCDHPAVYRMAGRAVAPDPADDLAVYPVADQVVSRAASPADRMAESG